MEVGEREIIYLSLHCHHQNDSCIKIVSQLASSLVNHIVINKTDGCRATKS